MEFAGYATTSLTVFDQMFGSRRRWGSHDHHAGDMIEVGRTKITEAGRQALEKAIGSKIFRNDAQAD